ncbi:HTH-type transcriptional regulator CynR [Devosia equisanguinis]|uniref:HTH-type transcriptional regulator CynR n=1 Tax=Devosia equisanguinis TaxID=2490941 RepID=A0A447I5Y1_9HYPH|nr:LysR family transcriptional regulator [Devosia equisanguinis]VDS02904.1 HTH-type transcriptional regulator CynR [Devosia equisanguinis]
MFRPPRYYLYLDAVARHGSIRRAATKLGVASTALNRKIIEIEEEMGLPLFERLAKGVRLTTAGEVLLNSIRRNLSDIETVNAQIEQLRGLVRGSVQLAIAHSVSDDLVPSAIAEYQAHHPRVQFQIIEGGTSDLLASLLKDDAEVFLGHNPPSSADFTTMAVVAQPLCAMMPPSHPLAGRSKLRLADCQPYPVALGSASFGSRYMIDQVLKRLHLTLDVRLKSSTVQSLKTFSRQTGAICFQFEIGTRRDVERGELVAIPLSDPELSRGNLVLGCRTGRKLSLPALSFSEALKQRLGRL